MLTTYPATIAPTLLASAVADNWGLLSGDLSCCRLANNESAILIPQTTEGLVHTNSQIVTVNAVDRGSSPTWYCVVNHAPRRPEVIFPAEPIVLSPHRLYREWHHRREGDWRQPCRCQALMPRLIMVECGPETFMRSAAFSWLLVRMYANSRAR